MASKYNADQAGRQVGKRSHRQTRNHLRMHIVSQYADDEYTELNASIARHHRIKSKSLGGWLG